MIVYGRNRMKVFISYSGHDGKMFAKRLTEKFENVRGWDVWYYDDPKYITGELPWIDIYTEIMKSDWMLVLTTDNTVSNMNQRNEFMNAIMNGIRTVAFTKKGSIVPGELKGRNIGYFDLANFDVSSHWLIQDLQKVGKSTENPVPIFDDVIKNIRFRTSGLDLDIIKQLRKMIGDRYLSGTVIRKIARISLLPDTDKQELMGQYMWWEDDLEQFQRKDIWYGVICNQIADAIISGEQTYLVKTLSKNSVNRHLISKIADPKVKYDKINEYVASLTSHGSEPDFMMLPVGIEPDYFRYVNVNDVTWGTDGRETLHFDNDLEIKVYHFIPTTHSTEIIIGSGKALRWSIRLDAEDGALATAIGKSPLYSDKVDFFAGTIFRVEILKPEAFAVVEIS